MLRHLIHYGIHFLVPIIIAIFFFRNDWKKVAVILLAGIVIDVDHLLATPLFDPGRCSIGYHPLHTFWAIMAYALLPFFKPTRIIGLALLLHIFADLLDCLLI